MNTSRQLLTPKKRSRESSAPPRVVARRCWLLSAFRLTTNRLGFAISWSAPSRKRRRSTRRKNRFRLPALPTARAPRPRAAAAARRPARAPRPGRRESPRIRPLVAPPRPPANSRYCDEWKLHASTDYRGRAAVGAELLGRGDPPTSECSACCTGCRAARAARPRARPRTRARVRCSDRSARDLLQRLQRLAVHRHRLSPAARPASPAGSHGVPGSARRVRWLGTPRSDRR